MIKVLFHIDELSEGGAEKVLCNLVNNMDLTKFDITVHTVYKCNAEAFLKKGIQYKYVFSSKSKINQMIYRLECELGVFYRFHLKGDYDIEIAYLECGPTKAMAGSTNKKALKLAWVHCDLEKKMPDMEAFVSKAKEYYSRYDRVVCVSENCMETYINHFGNIPECMVVHNTIDEIEILRKAEMNETIDKSENRKTIVAVGRLTSQKNFRLLLEAHADLIKSNVQHDLWIVGDGPEREGLQQFIDDQGLSDTAKLLGFFENPYPIMKKADFFVCSSQYEGYSTAIIEAMILGIPVLTVECTGMKEILGDSEYGLIVNNSLEGLKTGIQTYLTEISVYDYYTKKAVERATQLSGGYATELTENVFVELLREKNS